MKSEENKMIELRVYVELYKYNNLNKEEFELTNIVNTLNYIVNINNNDFELEFDYSIEDLIYSKLVIFKYKFNSNNNNVYKIYKILKKEGFTVVM